MWIYTKNSMLVTIVIMTLGLGCTDNEFTVNQATAEVQLLVPPTINPLRHQQTIETARLTIHNFDNDNNEFNVTIDNTKLPSWLRVEPKGKVTVIKNDKGNNYEALLNVIAEFDKCKETPSLVEKTYSVPIVFVNNRCFRKTSTLTINFTNTSKEAAPNFKLDCKEYVADKVSTLQLTAIWTSGDNSSLEEPIIMRMITPKNNDKFHIKFDHELTSFETKPGVTHNITVDNNPQNTEHVHSKIVDIKIDPEGKIDDDAFIIEAAWHNKTHRLIISPKIIY